MSLTYNPAAVTVAANLFNSTTDGAVQGFYQDDPAIRYQLRSSVLAPSQSTAIWGGCGITVTLPTVGNVAGDSASSLKAWIKLATAVANLTGFTVWNQSLATVLNPSVTAPIPLAANGDGTNPGGAINFFELGSNAQIWVQCTSAVATTLAGGAINQTVYWDYTNQRLATTGTGAISVKVVDLVLNNNALVVNSAGTGWTTNGSAALIQI
jgi:hypothetical protein